MSLLPLKVNCRKCGLEMEVHNADAIEFLRRVRDDLAYLDRTYRDLWTSGAGYVLKPRYLEIIEFLKQYGGDSGSSTPPEVKE